MHKVYLNPLLHLTVEPPQLTNTFKASTLQPGPSVYLKCVAAGNPTPEITWELDGTRLSNSERLTNQMSYSGSFCE